MATAHLFNCNSKTEVVTSLKLAYSSEDVLALNVDPENGVPKTLCQALVPQVQEATMADYSPLLLSACFLKTAQL